jgi:hypothetical protein
MHPNDSSARRTLEFRSSVPPSGEDAQKESEQPARSAFESGFFTAIDEYAGIERLDREELDETDHDVL